MNRRVVFLMSECPHAIYLVTALKSLREHWDGPVDVYAWPDFTDGRGKVKKGAYDIVARMAEDKRLGISAKRYPPEYVGKNAQFLEKIHLMKSLPEGLNLYLDADTVVHGSLEPLFEFAADTGFAATQFSNWVSTGGIPKGRIEKLREFDVIEQDWVEESISKPYPSVNGGVFVCSPGSPVLPTWEAWSFVARSVFISDEAAMHPISVKFGMAGQLVIATSSKVCWNCSVKRNWIPEDAEIRISHLHGDSAIRPEKFDGRGVDLWWPLFLQCVEDNLGFVQEWADASQADERHGWFSKLRLLRNCA